MFENERIDVFQLRICVTDQTWRIKLKVEGGGLKSTLLHLARVAGS